MMKATHSITQAERAGQRLGRAWRNLMRREARAMQWLLSKGLPAGLGRALFWIVKLAALCVLLYVAFWFALLLLFALAAAWVARNAPPEEDDEKAEWRMGWSGYGLYRGETRVDPGIPDDDD